MMNLWNVFLSLHFNCKEDEYGRFPCDCNLPCGKCTSKQGQNELFSFLRHVCDATIIEKVNGMYVRIFPVTPERAATKAVEWAFNEAQLYPDDENGSPFIWVQINGKNRKVSPEELVHVFEEEKEIDFVSWDDGYSHSLQVIKF